MEMGAQAEGYSLGYLARWSKVPEHAEAWDRIVKRHGLVPYTLDEFVNQSWDLADMLFAGPKAPRAGSKNPDPYASARNMSASGLMSTIKLRQAGFAECVDTEDMTIRWLEEMQALNMLPK